MTNNSYQLTIMVLLIASLALVRAQNGQVDPAAGQNQVSNDSVTFDANNGDNAGEAL
jgi:hypothetical protein